MNEFLELLTNPAHWGFEAVSNGLSFVIGATWHSRWVKRHDRRVHRQQAVGPLAHYGVDRRGHVTVLHRKESS